MPDSITIKRNKKTKQCAASAIRSPPMFAKSKLSRVILVRGGIFAAASLIAYMFVAFQLVVALNNSSAVYSLVSFKSCLDEE